MIKTLRIGNYDVVFSGRIGESARLMILLTLSDMMREGNQLAREACFLNASPDL